MNTYIEKIPVGYARLGKGNLVKMNSDLVYNRTEDKFEKITDDNKVFIIDYENRITNDYVVVIRKVNFE